MTNSKCFCHLPSKAPGSNSANQAKLSGTNTIRFTFSRRRRVRLGAEDQKKLLGKTTVCGFSYYDRNMSRTYRAILRGDRLQWAGDAPDPSAPLPVDVIVLDTTPNGSRGKEMADALAQIAARGGIASIPDPAAWQREIRQDRPLPGRDQ